MLYGIIDLGSNTVRLNVYECKNQKARLLFSKKETLGIISYVKKRVLNEEGMLRLCNVLSSFKTLLSSVDISNYSIFSTASLRNLKNRDAVIETIKHKTGMEIHVLQGETEGKLSFIGASFYCNQKEGLLIDIGGGSSELVYFKDKKIQAVCSLPMGSLSLFNEFVDDILPTIAQQKAMRKHIQKEIETNLPKDFPTNIPFLCGVGGSIRAIDKILNQMNLKEKYDESFSCQTLQNLLDLYKENPTELCHMILRCKPDRIHTLLPGLLITLECIHYFQCKQMQVSSFGVREGYLYHMVLGKGYTDEK